MSTRAVLGSITIAVCLAGLAVVHGADRPIDAVKLVLKESKSGSQTLTFLSKDAGFLFPVPGSDDDPVTGTPGGLVIDLLPLGEATVMTLVAPGGEGAEGWTLKDGKRARYKFANKKAPNALSPVKVALLKDGKVLKIVSKDIGFSPLVAGDGIAVRVTSGALRNCAIFGPGTIKTAKERKVVAKGASRSGVADCSDEALRGAGTTTTTIGGTTSTTVAGSTTTTTTTSTTSTTFPTDPPPDPSTVAPDIDPTEATSIEAAARFLYAGDPLIQFGVADGVIDPVRVAVIRGKVTTRDGTPLSRVRVTILRHPEFGGTLSRTDGMYDLAVNGGEPLTVEFSADGFLPAQRMIEVPWQDWTCVPDVALIPLDSQITSVDLAAPGMKMAQGTAVADDDGTRQATVLFPEGAGATMVMPDGTTAPLGSLSVRATEYTVGDGGPTAMPGQLPATSAYTYAVELSVDEALAAGASRVDFDVPLPFYVENFVGIPTGTAVPTGYYDRERALWVPSPNGRVIEILSTGGGLAEVDVDGSGMPADGAALADLGITDAERQTLASTYAAGTSLWRVPIPHFSVWDHNWPFGPPSDAIGPQPSVTSDSETADASEGSPGTGCESTGSSVLLCQDQVLGEEIAVAGTPFTLSYRSDRTPGRLAAYRAQLTVSGDAVPASLKRIDVTYEVGGKLFEQSLSAAASQTATLTWDGTDVYGRRLQGARRLRGQVGFVYDGVYGNPADFAASFGDHARSDIVGTSTRDELAFVAPFEAVVGAWDARAQGLGGWTLDVHHAYDPGSQTLHLGSGGTRRAASVGNVYRRVFAKVPNGQPADLDGAGSALTLGPDGSVYTSDPPEDQAFRVHPDGTVERVAGCSPFRDSPCQCHPINSPGCVPTWDGMPATEVQLLHVADLETGPDGALYVAGECYVFRVDDDGRIDLLAGDPGSTDCFAESGDGGPAIDAMVQDIRDMDVGPDGSIYLVQGNNVVRRIAPDGTINRFAGTGIYGFGGDGGYATNASFRTLRRVAVGPDGTVYLADSWNLRIRAVGTDGIIDTVVGTGAPGFAGDGGPAREALLGDVIGLDVGPDGRMVFMEGQGFSAGPIIPHSCRVRMVDQNGIIATLGGTGECGEPSGWPVFAPNGDLGTNYRMGDQEDIAVGPDGDIYFWWHPEIWKLDTALPSFNASSFTVASRDASELYEFSPTGRHLRTIDAYTGAVRWLFAYDAAGRLATVTDGDGNVTIIERDGAGNPTAIVAPMGQRTTLAVDGEGFLASIADPTAATWSLAYTADGLLETATDPRGHASTYQYDGGGRLTQARSAGVSGADPNDDQIQTLTRMDAGAAFTVSRGTAEGGTTSYEVDRVAAGTIDATNTHAQGTTASVRRGPEGRTITTADGTTLAETLAGDPRWGMSAPFEAASTISTPGGVTLTATVARSVELDDEDDLLSILSETETSDLGGATWTREYDAATRTHTLTSPEGRERTVTTDDRGRVERLQVASLEPLAFTYDDAGRVAVVTRGEAPNARSVTYAYDGAGNLSSVADPLGRTQTFTRDAAGRVTTLRLHDDREIGLAWDARSNLTSYTPPGRSPYLFTHTATNRHQSFVAPDLGDGLTTATYAYDRDGRVTGITRADGQQLGIVYDGTHNVASLASPRGTTTYTYDAAGWVSGIATPEGTTLAFAYDGFLPTTETLGGDVTGTVSQTYDGFLPATLSVNGDPITYGYDTDRLLTSAGALSLTRDAASGIVTGTAIGNVVDSYGFNGFAEQTSASIVANGVDSVYGVAYERDALGRVATRSETIGGVTTDTDYFYDSVGRLGRVEVDAVPVATYTYDDNDNRLSDGTTAATYDAQDRILTHGTTTYTHGPDGERLSKTTGAGTTTYDYDVFGNLLAVDLPGGSTIDYVVDGMNRRVGKKRDGMLERGFLYKDELNVVAELDGAGAVVSRFVYATNAHVPDYMVRGGETYRLVTDQVGSVRLVVNVSDGTVAQRIDYGPFGEVLADTNRGFQPFGFAGGLFDVDTGLVRFGARDYDPEIGRWTAKDPLSFGGSGSNLYAYVGNDPVNLVDPTGRIAPALIGALGAIAIEEITLTALDIASFIEVLMDPCASALEKIGVGALTVVGVVIPGGGLGVAGNGLRRVLKEANHVEDLLKRVPRPRPRRKIDDFYQRAFPDGGPQVVPQGRAVPDARVRASNAEAEFFNTP